MSTEEQKSGPLRHEVLDELCGDLPEHAARSLIGANVAIPINAAIAAKVLSHDATSGADVAQPDGPGQPA